MSVYPNSHQSTPEDIGGAAIDTSPEFIGLPNGLSMTPDRVTGEPIYFAQGSVVVDGEETKYTVAARESSDPDAGISGIIGGFSAFKSTSRALRNALPNTTFSFASVRSSGVLSPQDAQTAAYEAIVEDLPENPNFRKLPGSDRIDLLKRTAIGHSMGGLAAANTSADEIIFLAACGFGAPKIGKLIKDVGKNGLRAVISDVVPMLGHEEFDPLQKVFRKIVDHHRHPERTISEIISCLTADIREQVSTSSANATYIGFENDVLVPPNDQIKDHVNKYSCLPGLGHLAPQHSPRTVVAAIEKLAA